MEHASCIVRSSIKHLWNCHKDNIQNMIFKLAEILLSEPHEIRSTDLVHKEGLPEDWQNSGAKIIPVVIIITYPTSAKWCSKPKLTCDDEVTTQNFTNLISTHPKNTSVSNGNSNQKHLEAEDWEQTEPHQYLHSLTAGVLKGDRNVGEQFAPLAWLIDPNQHHFWGNIGSQRWEGIRGVFH